MNERIRELAKKAGGNITLHNLASKPVQHRESIELWDDRIEKFAKLVVQECVKILISGEGNDKTVDAIWDLGPAFDVDINQVLDRIES